MVRNLISVVWLTTRALAYDVGISVEQPAANAEETPFLDAIGVPHGEPGGEFLASQNDFLELQTPTASFLEQGVTLTTGKPTVEDLYMMQVCNFVTILGGSCTKEDPPSEEVAPKGEPDPPPEDAPAATEPEPEGNDGAEEAPAGNDDDDKP